MTPKCCRRCWRRPAVAWCWRYCPATRSPTQPDRSVGTGTRSASHFCSYSRFFHLQPTQYLTARKDTAALAHPDSLAPSLLSNLVCSARTCEVQFCCRSLETGLDMWLMPAVMFCCLSIPRLIFFFLLSHNDQQMNYLDEAESWLAMLSTPSILIRVTVAKISSIDL